LIALAAAGAIALFGIGLASFLDNNCTDLSGKDICQHILFIGNSYTYVNDLPGVFARLARAGGHLVQVDTSANGGWTLADHLKSTASLEKIRSRQWDYVVLQEQSQIPASPDARVATMYPAARALIREITAGGSRPVLYMTWAHKDGWPENNLPGFTTMQEQITNGYLQLAGEQGIPVVPVSAAWADAIHRYPELILWQDDGSHPSLAGSYLAACVFYAALFGQSPAGLPYHGDIPEDTARTLQTIAGEMVLNNPAQWNLRQIRTR
jgi:hypothetical protein